jgi:2-dehydro-3-deoxyphosphogluconate aldolase/(4S)-4-hydroxy-2-oxoglutarate aldolase
MHSKLHTLNIMIATGMVPVFYHDDTATAKSVMQACYDGGVRAFEFTNRGAFAHEVFASLSKYAAEECPDMVLGVGTIVDAPTAAAYMQMGARFVVGPLFNAEIARTCNRRQIPYIPGCGTASEIGWAQEAGCDICKIFPGGSVGGPSFVSAVLAPMPWTRIMATGGVAPEEENLAAWFRAGVSCVGMGSRLLPKEAIANRDWGRISRVCETVLLIIKKYRQT